MKLLIFTQKMNRKDPILGFFQDWVFYFSKSFESITVICLEKGEYDLPENVRVLSLGKEEGKSKMIFVFRFFKYIFKELKNYDKVFVHMNAEYVLLGGLFWRLFRKKIVLWRNHKSGSWKTNLAGILADNVCYTSAGSYTAKFKNAIQMPVGINDRLFHPINGVVRKPNSFLYIGRISPIKNIDKMIDGFILWQKQNNAADYIFDIIGPADSELDKNYKAKLIQKVKQANLSSCIVFKEAVTQLQLPEVYSSYEFCINLTESGSFDKTIWESVFCGCVPIVHNTSFLKEIPREISEKIAVKSLDAASVAQVIKSVDTRIDLMQISRQHSLENLMIKLKKII